MEEVHVNSQDLAVRFLQRREAEDFGGGGGGGGIFFFWGFFFQAILTFYRQ